jgi:hypothetical protein
MKEKQNTNADAQGLPLVAIDSSKTQRKETRRSVLHLSLFQDHLVLESKPRFSIIPRLENAVLLLFSPPPRSAPSDPVI